MTTLQAVVFAILMENNGGIIYKCPEYVLEKLIAVRREDPEALLDMFNLAKFRQWCEKWHVTEGGPK